MLAVIAKEKSALRQVVGYRELGVSEAQLLLDYPTLTAINLAEAWDYASRHPEEIAAEIRRNEVA